MFAISNVLMDISLAQRRAHVQILDKRVMETSTISPFDTACFFTYAFSVAFLATNMHLLK